MNSGKTRLLSIPDAGMKFQFLLQFILLMHRVLVNHGESNPSAGEKISIHPRLAKTFSSERSLRCGAKFTQPNDSRGGNVGEIHCAWNS